MSSPTSRFPSILSRLERSKTDPHVHPLTKVVEDALEGIRRERVLMSETLETFLSRATNELKSVVEAEVRAGMKLCASERRPSSPKSPRGGGLRRVRTLGDLFKSTSPDYIKAHDVKPLQERTKAPRIGSKNSTVSRKDVVRTSKHLPRTETQIMSEQKEHENKLWRNRIRQSVTKRLESAAKSNSPVGQLSLYFGLRPKSQSIIGVESTTESGHRNRAECLVSNPWFNVVVALVILVNAVVIGLQAESAAENAIANFHSSACSTQTCEYVEPIWYQIVGVALLASMIIEVAIRFLAGKRFFFVGPDWKWNVFDVLLLAVSFWEQLSDIQAFSHFRVLRGLRMIRVLRIIRVVRLFRELRLMVCSIARSLWSLTWAVALLLVGIYLVAVCFMYGVTTYIDSGENYDLRKKLIDWYGSIWSTMWMLLLSVTGGIDWEIAVAPLRGVHPLYPPCFALYVCFVLIGVLNTFTSVFVEQAREFGKLDRDFVIQTELAQNEAFMHEMRQIFEEVDVDGSGFITWVEFERYLENERVQAYFATQKLDVSEAHELFHMLSDGSVAGVDLEEFIIGCMRLKGQAKQGDLAILLREHKILNRKVRQFMRLLEPHFGFHLDHRMRATSHAASQLSQLSEHDVCNSPKQPPTQYDHDASHIVL